MVAMPICTILWIVALYPVYSAGDAPGQVNGGSVGPSLVDAQPRFAGDPCSEDGFKSYPVPNDATKFLHCDPETMSLVEGTCNIFGGVQKIYISSVGRCFEPNRQRLYHVPKSSGLGEPCAENSDCLNNMYCPTGTCQCYAGYFPKNQDCIRALAPGDTGCTDDSDCQHYWPNTRCTNGQCECVVPTDLVPLNFTASPAKTAESVVCVLTSGGGISFCPLPVPTASTPVQAGGPAVFTAPGLTCSVTNGVCQLTTGWDDMVDCVPTSTTDALCCPNRAHTCMEPKPVDSPGGVERFWYNQATRRCERFLWDGIQPWANNFNSPQHCMSYCAEICPRGYSKISDGQAETCDATCLSSGKECKDVPGVGRRLCCQKKADTCSPDGGKIPVTGNVITGVGSSAGAVRWRYEQGKCLQFNYTGWGGNYNNFDRKEVCERYCFASVCDQGLPLKDANGNFQTCGQGCPSSFECKNTVCCPKKQTVCTEPKVIGACSPTDYVTGHWYNALSQECEPFQGCPNSGNDNNFESRDECLTYCRGIKPTPRCPQGTPAKDSSGNVQSCIVGIVASGCNDDHECRFDLTTQTTGCCPRKSYTCGLPSDAGVVCNIPSVRWYFDSAIQGCRSFDYNGCDGNSNNFNDPSACERYCTSGGCPFGGEPFKQNGAAITCSAQSPCPSTDYSCSIIRIGTNSAGRCCLTRAAICRQPPNIGTACGAPSQRYYYDPGTRQCIAFTYGGCDGNENNFDKLDMCYSFCHSSACLGGETALMDPNTNTARTCNPSVTNSCPVFGYNCRMDYQTGRQMCCGSTDMGVCPADERAYVEARSGEARDCQPNTVDSCPNRYLCRQSTQARRHYCCTTKRTNVCPDGKAAYRDPQTRQLIPCAVGGTNVCPSTDYSCQASTPGQSMGFCCTNRAMCPNDEEFMVEATTGMPRECIVQSGYNDCRVGGYYCYNNNPSTPTSGHCCKKRNTAVSVTVVQPTNQQPILPSNQQPVQPTSPVSWARICPGRTRPDINPFNGQPQKCLQNTICRQGFTCQYSKSCRDYYCCPARTAVSPVTTANRLCFGSCGIAGTQDRCIRGYRCEFSGVRNACCYVGRRNTVSRYQNQRPVGLNIRVQPQYRGVWSTSPAYTRQTPSVTGGRVYLGG